MRSQSYEFESNSQLHENRIKSGEVVWGHKVTNLKATHNSQSLTRSQTFVVWGHKVTNLKATHNNAPRLGAREVVVRGHKVTNLKATHNNILTKFKSYKLFFTDN